MREASRSSYASRPRFWRSVRQEEWSSWIWQQQNRVRDVEKLCQIIPLSSDEIETINWSADRFRMAITPHYLTLIDGSSLECPIRLQAIPQRGEQVRFPYELDDPLAEEKHMPVPGLTHRYPDRVLVYMTHNCPVYCRHCTRKRKVSDPQSAPRAQELTAAIAYIAGHPEVRDVLLSGGDPLTFTDERLDEILGQIRTRAPHVRFLRIGSRMVVQMPTRVTPELCAVLEKHRVQMINIHINHPKEITPLLRRRVKMLQKAGIMMGLQTVCLKGVNDSVEVMRELFMQSIEMGVRPYYVYSTDMVEGAHHFIVPHRRMLELYEGLRGWISGPAVPTFIVDGLGGLGKLPIIPSYVREEARPDGSGTTVKCRNYAGKTVEMPGLGQDFSLPSVSN